MQGQGLPQAGAPYYTMQGSTGIEQSQNLFQNFNGQTGHDQAGRLSQVMGTLDISAAPAAVGAVPGKVIAVTATSHHSDGTVPVLPHSPSQSFHLVANNDTGTSNPNSSLRQSQKSDLSSSPLIGQLQQPLPYIDGASPRLAYSTPAPSYPSNLYRGYAEPQLEQSYSPYNKSEAEKD